MVRNYKRKTKKQDWTEENMQRAIQLWNSGKYGYRQAAARCNVSWSTLCDRIKKKNTIITGSRKGFVGGFHRIFTDEQEEQLCAYILRMEEVLLGLTLDDVRHVAYQSAVRNDIPHDFNADSQKAGEDWLQGFRRRRPLLSLCTPEATSAARARGVNKVNVDASYALCGKLVDAHHFNPGGVYNVDETGITTVQGRP